MKQKEQLSHEDIVSDILGSVPEEVAIKADFPSRGLFYTPYDPSKPVEIRPMTFEDERGLSSVKDTRGIKALEYLVGKCLINLNPDQVLEMDKLYILMKIREISYGSDFKANITCPECQESQPMSIDIAKLNINKVPEDLTDPREVFLPICKKKASVLFPRASDSNYLVTTEIAAANMWRFVDNINGCSDKKVISDVIEKLPLRDIHVLLDGIGQSQYGIDTKFLYKCDTVGCDCETKMEVPFDESFFTMR